MPSWKIDPNVTLSDHINQSGRLKLNTVMPAVEYIEHTMYWMDQMAIEYDWANADYKTHLFADDGSGPGFAWMTYDPADAPTPLPPTLVSSPNEGPNEGIQYQLTGSFPLSGEFWHFMREVTGFINEMMRPYKWLFNHLTGVTSEYWPQQGWSFPLEVQIDVAPIDMNLIGLVYLEIEEAYDLNTNPTPTGDVNEIIKYGRLRANQVADIKPVAGREYEGATASENAGWGRSLSSILYHPFYNNSFYDGSILLTTDWYGPCTPDPPIPSNSYAWREWNPEQYKNHKQKECCMMNDGYQSTVEEDWGVWSTDFDNKFDDSKRGGPIGDGLFTEDNLSMFTGYTYGAGNQFNVPNHYGQRNRYESAKGWAYKIRAGEGLGKEFSLRNLYGKINLEFIDYYTDYERILFSASEFNGIPRETVVDHDFVNKATIYLAFLDSRQLYLPGPQGGPQFFGETFYQIWLTLATTVVGQIVSKSRQVQLTGTGPWDTSFGTNVAERVSVDLSDITEIRSTVTNADYAVLMIIPEKNPPLDPTFQGVWTDYQIEGDTPINVCNPNPVLHPPVALSMKRSSWSPIPAKATQFPNSIFPDDVVTPGEWKGPYYSENRTPDGHPARSFSPFFP